jgi:hypothetical protein
VETRIGRKPPLPLPLSSIIIIKKMFYNIVLVQTHTSTQASTCRRLQPSLVYQPFLEGSFNPQKIAPVSTGRMLLLRALTLRFTADRVSSIFTLDQAVSTPDSHVFYALGIIFFQKRDLNPKIILIHHFPVAMTTTAIISNGNTDLLTARQLKTKNLLNTY